MPSEESLAEAKKMLYDLLLSPYHESSHYQITIACTYLEHPMRPSGKRCICGMVKGTDLENTTYTVMKP